MRFLVVQKLKKHFSALLRYTLTGANGKNVPILQQNTSYAYSKESYPESRARSRLFQLQGLMTQAAEEK